MKYIFSFAGIFLIPVFVFSQSFNTVQMVSSPNIISINKEIKPIGIKNDLDELTSIGEVESPVKLEEVDDFLGSGLFATLPLNSVTLTSSFGYRTHPVTRKRNSFHSGVDLVAKRDTVYSILHGIVKRSGYNELLGNYVEIKHGDYYSIYGHLSTRFVATNEIVKAGLPLGVSGSTGRVTGEHLHFTIKHKGEFINPIPFLARIINLKGYSLLSEIGHEQNINNSFHQL